MIYNLVNEVSLENFVTDPIYNCKILDLSKIPLAKVGSEVTVFVRYTHCEVTLDQIDEWIRIYGTLISESRLTNIPNLIPL